MVFVIFDPRFKSLHIMSSFVGRDHYGMLLCTKYDKKSLYPMLAKCYEHLHPFVKSFADEGIYYEDCSLDIFEQIASTSELAQELVKRELLLVKR
jgi:hypothetical protein